MPVEHPAAQTTPERDAARLEGHTNAGVGRALFVSETTVKTHLVHIFEKLGVSTRTAAVSVARQRGVIHSS